MLLLERWESLQKEDVRPETTGLPHLEYVCFRECMYRQACYSGCKSLVKLMLESGVDVTTRDYDDDLIFPIELAAVHGHDNVVQLLLKNNAERNTLRSRLGTISHYSTVPMSPLQVATFHGHEDVVQTLLDSGIRLDSLDVYFAFVQASRVGQTRTMKLFLKNGLDINMYPRGCSPDPFQTWGLSLGERSFIVAFMHHMTTSIELLVAEGVPIYIPDFSNIESYHVESVHDQATLIAYDPRVEKQPALRPWICAGTFSRNMEQKKRLYLCP
ncbi:hypothetical protein OCU04_004965 [Sclerotinia nivalis]|uniref:Ankyrin repeat protein n=1 Tax=Sclerotinia nivalis TaxID=352851 RepID=A0A9X0ARL8_9HELO|nr:hypothetical protein OCU04_004965 [Sclerotinia nivalis]